MMLMTICNSTSRRFGALFWPYWAPGTRVPHIHPCRQNTQIHKIFLKLKKKHKIRHNAVPYKNLRDTSIVYYLNQFSIYISKHFLISLWWKCQDPFFKFLKHTLDPAVSITLLCNGTHSFWISSHCGLDFSISVFPVSLLPSSLPSLWWPPF